MEKKKKNRNNIHISTGLVCKVDEFFFFVFFFILQASGRCASEREKKKENNESHIVTISVSFNGAFV